MKTIIKKTIALFILVFSAFSLYAQYDQVEILNDILTTLKGDQGVSDIPVFTNIDEVCSSNYIKCSRKRKIIGFDLQFANLNGHIPEDITKLVDLEYVNIGYNYVDGVLPQGLSKMKYLVELTLNGNFLSGPLPVDIDKLAKKVDIDLSQNTFKINDRKLVKKLNIVNQFNLEGCRSPDSIFLAVDIETEIDTTILDAVTPKEDEEFKIVETMPRFPGCEDNKMSEEEKKNCASQTMLQFIYKNLRYPYEARVSDIQGMVVVQFVVLENGDIGDAKVKKDPGGRLGNSGLWIVNRMNYTCDKWIPGSQGGKEVKVQYTLPIKFKLEG